MLKLFLSIPTLKELKYAKAIFHAKNKNPLLITLQLQFILFLHPFEKQIDKMDSLRVDLDADVLVQKLLLTPTPPLLEQSQSCVVDYGCDANDIQKDDLHLKIPLDYGMAHSSQRSLSPCLSLRTNELETSHSGFIDFDGHSPAAISPTISPSTDYFREESVSYSSSSSMPMSLLLLRMAESEEDISLEEHGYSQMGVISDTLQGI